MENQYPPLKQAWHLIRSAALKARLLAMSPYERRKWCECRTFNALTQVHDLPEIFHYWSNRYLLPQIDQFGVRSPDHLFEKVLSEQCQRHPDRVLNILSIGAGNCDQEITLARKLNAYGQDNFRILCMDISEQMLARGREAAQQAQLQSHLEFVEADFNTWQAEPESLDVVLANQCLHHVVELEHLFDQIHLGLVDDGALVTSDMIGRNGHQRWPETLDAIADFWNEMPDEYHRNCQWDKLEPEFVNRNHAEEGFEGIRAQDILPLLCERFEFGLFVPFANIITVFIDRAFGPHFDPDNDWDRDFIDRVHARDAAAIESGEWTPTQMMATLHKAAPPQRQFAFPDRDPSTFVRTE